MTFGLHEITTGKSTLQIGNPNQTQFNINAFDASKSAASTVLIGRAATKSTLRGGLTENAIWGGGYASQDMQGSVAAVDTIWFGTTDGADTFSKGADQGDTIYLWDVKSIDAVKITTSTVDDKDYDTVVLGGSTLTIRDDSNTALDGGLSFKLSMGDTYTYDKSTKKFTAKA